MNDVKKFSNNFDVGILFSKNCSGVNNILFYYVTDSIYKNIEKLISNYNKFLKYLLKCCTQPVLNAMLYWKLNKIIKYFKLL